MLGHVLTHFFQISVFAALNGPLMRQTCHWQHFELAPSTLVFAVGSGALAKSTRLRRVSEFYFCQLSFDAAFERRVVRACRFR